MRNEMDAFSAQVSAKFQPIANQVLPQLNALDDYKPSTNSINNNNRLPPAQIVQRSINSIKSQAIPPIKTHHSNLLTSNTVVRSQLQSRQELLQERLKALFLKREVVTAVLAQINSMSCGEDGELERLVECMRKQEYAKVL